MTESNFVAMLKKTVNPSRIRESLVDSSELSDVIFELGPDDANKEELHAHKFFLITSSPVLHDILVKESNFKREEEETVLRIRNIVKATMVEVCRYAYSDTVKFTTANMFDILQAGMHLQMKFLVERAIDYISRDGLNENTVLSVIEANKQLNNTKLSIKCFDYIKRNYQKCFNAPAFMDMTAETFQQVIENCELPLKAAEIAIQKWSESSPENLLAIDELKTYAALNCVDGDVNRVTDSDSDATSIADSIVSRPQSHAGDGVRNRQGNRQRAENDVKGPAKNGAMKKANAQVNNTLVLAKVKQKLTELQHQVRMECEQSPLKLNFAISGDLEMKFSKFSNLDFNTTSRVMIHEILFLYDLRTTDKDFELQIYDVTQKHQKESLFFQQAISTGTSTKGGFTRFKLTRPCVIDGPKNLWISIEFGTARPRASITNLECELSQHMTLRGHHGPSKSSQVVSNVIFSLY